MTTTTTTIMDRTSGGYSARVSEGLLTWSGSDGRWNDRAASTTRRTGELECRHRRHTALLPTFCVHNNACVRAEVVIMFTEYIT